MAKTTTTYGLTKPEANDFYDVEKFNENMDKIDSSMMNRQVVILTSNDDLNKILTAGFYMWLADDAPLNAPNITNLRCMRVSPIAKNSNALQEICYFSSDDIGANNGCVIRRIVDSRTSAPEWDWVNPPMKTGVEYRTTERYQGEPVYVTLQTDGIVHKRTKSGLDITPITYGKTDLVDGESALATGCLYFVYE